MRRDHGIMEGVKAEILQQLRDNGTRTKSQLILKSGEPRDVVHRALRQLQAEGAVRIEKVPKGGQPGNGFYVVVSLESRCGQ